MAAFSADLGCCEARSAPLLPFPLHNMWTKHTARFMGTSYLGMFGILAALLIPTQGPSMEIVFSQGYALKHPMSPSWRKCTLLVGTPPGVPALAFVPVLSSPSLARV